MNFTVTRAPDCASQTVAAWLTDAQADLGLRDRAKACLLLGRRILEDGIGHVACAMRRTLRDAVAVTS